ncbi:hypothetical protein DW778_00920 [Odoribacter splanchnicus]|jgi:hypothetical protein|uniref:DUF4959 domain-containing protein n=3 Tax=Odoribacteraceae TaxID=1853231 RepID=A0A412TUB7_9BACT|nr:hypothetical protein B5F99_16595 [Odoribacter splanchnicus]OUO16263.1 hypothetical protein B5F93_01650 [Odoribacter splanchnicus]RGU57467.1 hypothetical protein DWW57_05760 [Odoribacter splanchnicus]RHA42524.1 hypothetical protein DW936_04340 [Odoribacter splanchnicus]RHD87590.1 hypothetical protein DW778_00920 [Odoribacter splanchnicus]
MIKIMKTKYFIYPLLMFSGLCACTPDEDELVDFSDFQIAKVELGADHRQLIADGISTLTLNPMLYQPYKIQTDDGRDTIVYGKIPVDRLAEGTVQYFLEDGTPLKEGKYRTTDLSKSEQGFYVTANGLKSDVFKVSIREPFAEDAYETITYPVVFHLIQDKTKVELGQGVGADIVNYAFNTIYNCFARTAAFSPNGADTKIRFRLAEYDPNGRKMEEKGINRYSLSTSDLNNLNPEKIKNNPKICWDYKRYLNIWIVENMGNSVSTPHYILNTADLNQIQGVSFEQLSLEEIEKQEYSLTDIGLIYGARDFAIEDVGYPTQMGKFFGLLDTENQKEDYCEDTFAYNTYKEPWNTALEGSNSRLKISTDGLIFYSVNIMDASSYKNTISMDQVKRIRTITDNCPHRWAWKSDWAFTGK